MARFALLSCFGGHSSGTAGISGGCRAGCRGCCGCRTSTLSVCEDEPSSRQGRPRRASSQAWRKRILTLDRTMQHSISTPSLLPSLIASNLDIEQLLPRAVETRSISQPMSPCTSHLKSHLSHALTGAFSTDTPLFPLRASAPGSRQLQASSPSRVLRPYSNDISSNIDLAMASASGHITDVSLASDYPDSEFESDTLLFESMLAITPLEGSVAGSCHAPCTLPSPDSTWLFRSAWTRGALAVAAAEAKHTAQPQLGSQLVAPVQPLPLATVLVLAGSEVSLDILQTAEVATLSAGAADQLGFCEAEVFDLAMGAALTMQRRAVGRPWQLVGRSSAREEDLQEVLCSAQPLVNWAIQAGGQLVGPGERQAAPAAVL
ncbi:hypothetical protein V8C86DRAFT_2622473 [Haematococcus lacustris]